LLAAAPVRWGHREGIIWQLIHRDDPWLRVGHDNRSRELECDHGGDAWWDPAAPSRRNYDPAISPVSSVGCSCEFRPMTKEVQITFDAANPAGLASFWAEALGYHLQPPPEGYRSWDAALEAFGVPYDQWNSRSAIMPTEGPHPRIFFQRVPEGKTAKNRLHLDVRVAPGLQGDERMSALETEATRLEGLGATRAYRVMPDEATMESGFITMYDPEGNEFCLD